MPEIGKKRILLVDDDDLVRDRLLEALSRRGYAVETAVDGVEAIRAIQSSDFDVTLLDLMMPKMDGYSVINFMLSRNPALLRRVIVLSSRENTVFRSIFAALRKPVSDVAVVSMVERCIAEMDADAERSARVT